MAKRILITGANSYIGTSFEKWVSQWPEEYIVDTVDMVNGTWREMSFVGYDVVFHVAGIAHADTGIVSAETKDLYYKINHDLTFETASKAKRDSVKQFIFMSSIIVYGSKNTVITKDTVPQPDNFYGNSKLQAEKAILPLSDESFNVVILRPPMIYGKGSKGNYPLLSKIAIKTPIFPDYNNQRSMLYIDNLCEFIRLIINNEESGLFFPQNEDYVKTSDLVQQITKVHCRKVVVTRCFNWLITLMKRFPGKIGTVMNKAFGSLVYEKSLSEYKATYQVLDFQKSVVFSE